jgi:hypothetical protein
MAFPDQRTDQLLGIPTRGVHKLHPRSQGSVYVTAENPDRYSKIMNAALTIDNVLTLL